MMRCLFCKRDSSLSRSVEHIIPESLGNHTFILSAGIVCDTCNNYFARKVEKPFLDLPMIAHLRFDHEIQNKRGKVPHTGAILWPDAPAIVVRHKRSDVAASVVLSQADAAAFLNSGGGVLVAPESPPLPAGPVLSRFLAKVALEAMAHRLATHPEGLDYLVGEKQLDPVRMHAREGRDPAWPVHVRRIYGPDAKRTDSTGSDRQVVHESDVLVTEEGEWYFVLALYGLELTINYGGPELDGYLEWIQKHGGVSPLHWGKNAATQTCRPAD
jgi:hypothetical protein